MFITVSHSRRQIIIGHLGVTRNPGCATGNIQSACNVIICERQKTAFCVLQRRYTAPPNLAGIQLKSVIGYNGNGRANMVWHPDTGRVRIYYNLIIEMVMKSNNHQATYPMLLFNYRSFHFAHQKLFEKAFNFTGDLAVLWSSKMKHIQWL